MKQINRRDFMKWISLSGTALAWTGCLPKSKSPSAAARKSPNVVFIVSDDQGWNDIGYHNPEIVTPNLDRLARFGLELGCHYVQPQCTPTRVALMTGRYPSRFGTHCTQASNEQAYPLGTLTMAAMFKSLGYETAITGKWHMGSLPQWGPNHYGFDYSYGSLAGAVGMYDHRYRPNTPFTQTWHRNHNFIEQTGHATDLVAEEAVRWIKNQRRKPFFLYVPFHPPHTPLVEERQWLDKNQHIQSKDRRLFAAAVTHMDDAVGRIIQALEATGQRQNTLIIFVSDNGGIHSSYPGNNYPGPDPALKKGFSSNLPLRGGKTEVFEGGIRVPALVNWPAHFKPAKVTAPMHVVDWLPTLANLLGFKAIDDPQWDGLDVWPILTGQKAPKEIRQFYWVWGSKRNRLALRNGPWKILRNNPKAKWQLFNLDDDPYEKNNLVQQHPEILKNMQALFQQQKARDQL